ncbi:helix-turn-helix domain-containing protein [Thiovibrio sp. JS02]
MDPEKPLIGGAPIINIDGLKIRQIREEKGLTQLYVSTVVGVTTDTISRWENRRYPTIKKENAIRLAEALEVPLEAIIDAGQKEEAEANRPAQPEPEAESAAPLPPSPGEPPAPQRGAESSPRSSLHGISARHVGVILGALFVIAIGLTIASWWNGRQNADNQVAALRSLPAHVPPAGIFPVLIEVTTNSAKPFSLILKETLPPGCTAVSGSPAFVEQEKDRSVIKWIGKVSGDYAVFSYLAKLDAKAPPDGMLTFSGGITLRSGDKTATTVSGANSARISPYHWADGNSDGRIDDEEILSVYDTYGAIEGFEFDQKRIEDIWSSKGYRWNPASRNFEILP